MGFTIPKYLQNYLDSTKYRKPFENFVDNSTYYSQLNWQWMSYMQNVVRPCIAYSTASVDGGSNTMLSTSAGMAILRGASRLVSGDKYVFLGNDESCAFLSDIWATSVNFNRFLSRAVSFMLSGGTAVLKWNRDELGRSSLSAFRIDRTIVTANENGDVTSAVFFIGLLSKMKNDSEFTYWLTEERKYDKDENPVVCYKVFVRSGTANSPTLPSPYQSGVSLGNLPKDVREELRRMRVTRLNEEIPLPTRDGLGIWLMSRTAVNSCVPDAPFGDPLLYGCLDILWSIDIVFSGSIVDVFNGEGKIIVPKQFLQDTLNRLQAKYPSAQFNVMQMEPNGEAHNSNHDMGVPQYNVTTDELKSYHDESFVYVIPSGMDKDKIAPTPVQFDIRAEQYGKMMEMYERLATVRAGFSPTSIFPYLTPDNSAKTAREVTAEENLTRASVKEIHNIISPVLTHALREVLWQEGFDTDVQLQLGDYVGNKLEFDANVRDNYAAGLVPKKTAVKVINNLTDSETDDYLEKIAEDDKEKQSAFGGSLFNEKDYFGTDGGGAA